MSVNNVEQDPVAWRYRDARNDKSKWTVQKNRPDWWKGEGPAGYVLEPLYAHPATHAPVEAGQQAFALGLKAAEDQVRSMRATDGVLCPRTISLVASGLAIAATKARAQSA